MQTPQRSEQWSMHQSPNQVNLATSYNKYVVNQYMPPKGLNTYKKNELKPSF